eukprot:c25681_g1_i1 orf=19-222(-)
MIKSSTYKMIMSHDNQIILHKDVEIEINIKPPKSYFDNESASTKPTELALTHTKLCKDSMPSPFYLQ